MNLLNSDEVSINYFNYARRSNNFRMSDSDSPMTVLDLTLCIEGEMHYIYNGEHITLRSGDGILILPGSLRERFETDVPTLYASINLIFENVPEFEFEGYLPQVMNSDILFLLDLLKKEYPVVSAKRNEKCLALFEYIYNSIYETICNTENAHVKAIKQYIFDNLSDELTLEKIASQVHLAQPYVCSLFKKETGMTLMQFIIKSRVYMAKSAIIATNAPISEIAESCGFNDYCYFSHVFKKITGISARQYRTAKKNN